MNLRFCICALYGGNYGCTLHWSCRPWIKYLMQWCMPFATQTPHFFPYSRESWHLLLVMSYWHGPTKYWVLLWWHFITLFSQWSLLYCLWFFWEAQFTLEGKMKLSFVLLFNHLAFPFIFCVKSTVPECQVNRCGTSVNLLVSTPVSHLLIQTLMYNRHYLFAVLLEDF